MLETSTARLKHKMAVLKHLPEDFVVDEVSTIKPKESGRFVYFRLRKRGYNTIDALKQVAIRKGLPMTRFSFAGLKDKTAITSQVCGVEGVRKETLERIVIAGIDVEFLGYGDEPVHVGDLEGNKFRITIRNLDALPSFQPKFRNLFGVQRLSKQNADVGRHLVKREFAKVCELLNIQVAGIDYIGGLRKYSRKLLLFFVHAYQSLLWNRAAMMSQQDRLPVVGFGTIVDDDATKAVLAEESVSPRDFIIRELPEVSAEGAVREVWVEARDLAVGALEDDEHFPGKKKVTISFFLPKGCYATEFVRQSVSR